MADKENTTVNQENIESFVEQYNTLVGEKNNLLAILNEMKLAAGNHSVEIASRDAEIKRLNAVLQQLAGGNQKATTEEE